LPGNNGQTVDTIAAVVNNGVITRRELDDRIGLITHRLNQQNAPVPPMDQLRQQVLNQMVLERIQLQKAKEDGINIDDAAVQKTLERLAQANNMSLDMYRSRIEAQGVPWATFTKDARTELTLSRLREKEVDSKVTVSDAEVANYIASQRGPNAGLTSDLHLQHIFLKAPLNASETDIETAQKKAQALLAEAKGGANFEKLAKSNSQAPDASKGGDAASGRDQPGSDPHQRRLRNLAPRRSSRRPGHELRCTEARANARSPHSAARRRRHVRAASASEAA
jgi:peptidyl-prolyl cis-trans isomerase SurA